MSRWRKVYRALIWVLFIISTLAAITFLSLVIYDQQQIDRNVEPAQAAALVSSVSFLLMVLLIILRSLYRAFCRLHEMHRREREIYERGGE